MKWRICHRSLHKTLLFSHFQSHLFLSLITLYRFCANSCKKRERKSYTLPEILSECVCVWYCILRRPFRFWSFSFNLISSSGQSHKLHLTSLTRWWLVDSVLWSFTPHILSWWWVCAFFSQSGFLSVPYMIIVCFVSFQKP